MCSGFHAGAGLDRMADLIKVFVELYRDGSLTTSTALCVAFFAAVAWVLVRLKRSTKPSHSVSIRFEFKSHPTSRLQQPKSKYNKQYNKRDRTTSIPAATQDSRTFKE